MGSKEILEQALQLRPDERFILVEGLLKSLDEPDYDLDATENRGRTTFSGEPKLKMKCKMWPAPYFVPGLNGGPCPPYNLRLPVEGYKSGYSIA